MRVSSFIVHCTINSSSPASGPRRNAQQDEFGHKQITPASLREFYEIQQQTLTVSAVETALPTQQKMYQVVHNTIRFVQ